MALSREVYKAFEDIVGPINISEEPAVLETYRCAAAQSSAHYGPYDHRTPMPQAVILPSSTAEVQGIILVCNRYGIKFKASTTFWSSAGYIGDDNSVQLDMRRMADIEIDPINQTAIIEPYAVTVRVQAEAMKHGLTCAVAGMGCSSSIVASTFGWQGGGPSTISTGNNYDNMLGAEYVLPNGEILRLGSLASGGWFCSDGPVFSLRSILRGGSGLAGEMGVCTKEVFFMEKPPATMMKEFVNSQKFESTTEVMAAMKEMFAEVLQQVMECELEEKLGYKKSERISETDEKSMSKNYRNGYSKKTVKTQLGEVDIRVPRDRNGEYEPQIVAKYDRNADGMEEKILGLYACGMSQRNIAEQIKALYDVEISPE